MRSFALSLLFFSATFASVDTLYSKIYNYLNKSVLSLDQFLAQEYNTTANERFSFRVFLDTIKEESLQTSYKFGIKANIRLSHTIQKLNLFLEDFQQREDLNANTQSSIPDSIEENAYLLGIQYLTRSFLRYRGGIKFNNLIPDPFFSIGAEKSDGSKKWWVHYGARVLYSIKSEFDDRAFINFHYQLAQQLLLSLSTTLRYEQQGDNRYQETNILKLYYSPSRYQLVSTDIGIYFSGDRVKNLALHYYYCAIDYSNRFFRPWLFYQISPGFVFRKENNFQPTFRILFRIGLTFEKY